MSNINSKHCDFTFALSDIEQSLRIISELPDFDTWAYIKHSPDVDNGSEHYHFYIHLKQPITLKNMAQKLDLAPNMVEWVRNKTKMIQYLVHKNNPDKIQYNDSEIETNNREYIGKFLNPKSTSVDLECEFNDLRDVVSGKITPFYYLSLHSDSISNLPFYSRQLFLTRILSLARQGYGEERSRIELRDSHYRRDV